MIRPPRTLRRQLILLFGLLTLLPAVILTTMVTLRLMDALERWEHPGVQRALTGSLDVARELIGRTENDLRQRGQLLVGDPVLDAPIDKDAVRERLALSYNLDFLQLYDTEGALLFQTTRDPAVTAPGALEGVALVAAAENPFLRDAPNSAILAYAGLRGGPGEIPVILVAGVYLDADFYARVDDLSTGVAIYRSLPYLIRVNQRGVLLSLGFALLVLTGIAIGLARWLAGRISRPVSALGAAMENLAAGESEVHVEPGGGEEIERLMETFNDMSRELARSRELLVQAERQAGWREVARRVAHEMRNALTPMTFSLHRLRKLEDRLEGDERERVTRAVHVALEEVEGLQRLAATFGELARLPVPEMKTLDLAPVVASVVEGAAAPGITLHWQAPTDPVPVAGDAALLRQAVTNVLRNATEAVGEAGSVWVELSGGAETRLTVSDDGPGWPGGESVLEPYVTTKEGGTGLGLSLVQRTLLQHGGSIRLDDRPGGGARVTLLLPGGGPGTHTKEAKP